jgi:hypothetical protein
VGQHADGGINRDDRGRAGGQRGPGGGPGAGPDVEYPSIGQGQR